MTTKGAPYPSQEENAMNCIMQFAIEHLKFPEEQIILHGWSIGGYASTWAAMNYPSIRSLVMPFNLIEFIYSKLTDKLYFSRY